jgi:hypothetical protein
MIPAGTGRTNLSSKLMVLTQSKQNSTRRF